MRCFMNCAIYDKTKIQNQRVVINFLAGGLLAAAFALCVGCGSNQPQELNLTPTPVLIATNEPTVSPTYTPTTTPTLTPSPSPTPMTLVIMKWIKESSGDCFNDTLNFCSPSKNIPNEKLNNVFQIYSSCEFQQAGGVFIIDCTNCTSYAATCGMRAYTGHLCTEPPFASFYLGCFWDPPLNK